MSLMVARGGRNPRQSEPVVTSYSNPGGIGDRTALVAVSLSAGLKNASSTGASSNLINGAAGNNDSASIFFASAGVVDSNSYMRFDFGSGNQRIINEARWIQSGGAAHGSWRWQGSNDATNWIDIGSPFTLGGATTQIQTTIAGNTTGYRFYQLQGVSGATSDSPWIYEIEFKIF